MRTLIVGGGAVGLGLASCLIKAGEEVHVLARKAATERLRREGLRRTGIFGTVNAAPDAFACHASPEEIPASLVFDYILVCVKSFDTATVAREMASRPSLLEGAPRFVLCQNGWGNRESFAAILPEARIYNARIITGFTRPRENQVEITVHANAVRVGTLGNEPLGDAAPLCEALARGDLPAETTPTIGRDLWAKMLYNCALNPLGAIFGVSYGTLAEREETRSIMDNVLAEVFAVMTAAGYDTHWKTLEACRQAFYEQMIPPTAPHHSSMLQDIRAGRRIEIDALNGAVVNLGDRHSIPTPVNAVLCRMVRFLERYRPAEKTGSLGKSGGTRKN